MKKFLLSLPLHALLTLKCFAINWSLPIDISESNAENSLLAIDGSGDAVATWVNFDGSNVVVRSIAYTGTWSSPENRSSAGFNAHIGDIAKSSTGDAVLAVWRLYDGANSVIQTAAYSAGSWGTTQTLSTPGMDAREPQVSINSFGNGFAVWTESGIVKVALFSGGIWGVPQTLSDIALVSKRPVVALSDSGTAIAAWRSRDPIDNSYLIQVASNTLGDWSLGEPLSTDGVKPASPQVVINATGVGFAIWGRNNDPINNDAAAVSLFAGGVWSVEEIISDPAFNATSPRIAINDLGSAVAVWQNSDTTTISIGAARFFAGIWGSPQTVSPLPAPRKIKIGINGLGNAIAVWSALAGGKSVIYYSENSLGIWTSPLPLSDTDQDALSPQITMNPAGEALVVWDGFNGTDYLIQGAIGVP